MKILVAFYSRSGNTKRAAGIIAKTLGAEMDEIIDKKNRRGGFWAFSGPATTPPAGRPRR